ncbi:TPA: secretion protein EspH [Escherichia albertii]|uniref:secretion protein EspH n=1 Tax=Escherichia albertii TaxID=208962 RepID=UPI0005CD496E|nr:secretion protein EspH [Escherichia albertii]MCQ8984349.1 secretion protein EspH [Escherichia albertii]MCQ9015579.1 secretion protein EspH [Escherichia albertii]MCU7330799.1 secretion protein EspH [Escherichia albertii]MCU7353575.1 secretion protein EspH [Escherichia albertii]UUL41199.1 secretion protein EspH [Escherichia albertii]
MPSSLSGPIFRTTLTSQHASWNKFSRTLHIPNNDTVDEIQLKARMQQRHHRVYPDIDNFTVVSFRGKEYSVRFIKDGDTDNYVYKVQKMTTENGCFSKLFSFLSGGVTKALERRLNERHITPLSSIWFPRTPLEGILAERGLSSLLRRVQSTERLDYPGGATTSTPFSNAVV